MHWVDSRNQSQKRLQKSIYNSEYIYPPLIYIHEQLEKKRPDLVRKTFTKQERTAIWYHGQATERRLKDQGEKKDEWKKERYWKDMPALLVKDPYLWPLRKVKEEYIRMVR